MPSPSCFPWSPLPISQSNYPGFLPHQDLRFSSQAECAGLPTKGLWVPRTSRLLGWAWRCLASQVPPGENSSCTRSRASAGTALPQVPSHAPAPTEGFGSSSLQVLSPARSRAPHSGTRWVRSAAPRPAGCTAAAQACPRLCLQRPPAASLRGRRGRRGKHAANRRRRRA